jgi:hypothetical protein
MMKLESAKNLTCMGLGMLLFEASQSLMQSAVVMAEFHYRTLFWPLD